jgi:hypothetical protein
MSQPPPQADPARPQYVTVDQMQVMMQRLSVEMRQTIQEASTAAPAATASGVTSPVHRLVDVKSLVGSGAVVLSTAQLDALPARITEGMQDVPVLVSEELQS